MITLNYEIKKINNYVDIYDGKFFEGNVEVGWFSVWYVHAKKMINDGVDESMFNTFDSDLFYFKKYLKDLDLKDNFIVYRRFVIHPEHQRQGKAVEASHPFADTFIELGARYILAHPFPVYEDKNVYEEDKERVKNDSKRLIEYYVEKYTYRGKYIQHGDIIVKEMI